MARTDDDSWDLASSVGATATLVATGRALATVDPNPLINDPFAAPLVRAVGIDFFIKAVDGELDPTAFTDGAPTNAQHMVDGMAVRTKFFDDYCLDATASGVRQVVILASCLDARAYRLDWPAGTVVYELDQPKVIAFKTQTLADLGAEPTAERRAVAIDLREDWPGALREAGFDPSAPTAWIAEGLLIYLPPEAQDRLFDQITELSGPGSWVGTEYVPGIMDFDHEAAQERASTLRTLGLDLDFAGLVYSGERSHVMEYLADKGWAVSGATREELFSRYGREPATAEDKAAAESADPLGEIVYVSATLG